MPPNDLAPLEFPASGARYLQAHVRWPKLAVAHGGLAAVTDNHADLRINGAPLEPSAPICHV